MAGIFRCFVLIVVACGFTGIVPLAGGDPDGPGQEPAKSRIQVETGLVEVRTVVTDRDGRIVEGLTKEDFELLENDEPRDIAHFTVSKIEDDRPRKATGDDGGVEADEETRLRLARDRIGRPPVRTILLYADALHLSFAGVDRVKRALYQFIDTQLTDQDLVAFTSSETLGVAQQFTQNRNILRHAVEQIRYRPTDRDDLFTPKLAAEFLDGQLDAVRLGIDIMRRKENMICPCSTLHTMAHHKANQVLDEETYTRENTLSIIEHFAAQMKDLPGKRIIAVFSEGFTLYNQSGVRQMDQLQQAISRAVRTGVALYTIDVRGLRTPPEIDAAQSSMERDPGYELLVECIRACPEDDDDALADCLEACIRTYPVSFECLQDIGDFKNPKCEYPEPGMLAMHLNLSEIEQSDGLHSLAEDTGGRLYEGMNDLNIALGQALDDNRFYYVLSYYLKEEKNKERFLKIRARVRNHPEYTVRTPRGFWSMKVPGPQSGDDDSTPQQLLIQAMGFPLPATDIGVSARADFVQTEDDDKQVSLTVFFEGDSLQYQEGGRGGTVGLEIVSLIYDSSGDQVDGISAHVEGDLIRPDIEKARASGYRYVRRIPLEPGVYQTRIGVREEGTNRIGTATTWVEVPEIQPDTLEMSSLILSSPLDADLVDPESIDMSGLEKVKMIQGIPMYSRDDIFYYAYRVHPDQLAPEGADLLLMSVLLQGGEPVRTEQWQPLLAAPGGADSKGWIDSDGELDIGGLAAGVYELRVLVKEKNSDRTVQRTVAFGIY